MSESEPASEPVIMQCILQAMKLYFVTIRFFNVYEKESFGEPL